MKAIRYHGPEKISVDHIEKPERKQGWALIKVAYAGICGTDMTIYMGKHPRAKGPLVMGHEFSGYIVESEKYKKGELVTVYPYLACHTCDCCKRGDIHVCENIRLIGIDLDGGMAEYVTVPEDSIYPVSQGISPELAAFIEPIGITVHAVRKGGYKKGGNVVIFGAGAIGMSCALTLRRFGAEKILIIDPNENRSQLARKIGFEIPLKGEGRLEAVIRFTNGKGADFVYDCAGCQAVADILPDSVRINGQIVIVAGYKTPPSMDFQKGMFREFTVQFVRNCSREDFETASRIADKDYASVLNCILPIEKAQAGFDVPEGAYKVMFKIGEEDKV